MKIYVKKRLALFIMAIFISSAILTGCSMDKSEIKEISAVLGIGIDKVYGDEPIVVTVEIVGTGTSSINTDITQKENKSVIEVSKGKTLYDAIENFSETSPTILDFSHTNIIILSKSFSESEFPEMLDYMNRDRQFRSINWVLIADKTAKEILESKIANQDITSIGIESMMTKLKKDPSLLPVNLNNFIVNLEDESNTSVAPVIDIKQSNNTSRKEITIENMAVFKNNRYIGELTKDESKNYLWLADNTKGYMVEFPFKLESQGKEVTLLIHKKSSKIVPYLTDNGVRFEIECTGIAELKEVDALDINQKTVSQIEYNTGIILKSKINELIYKSQKELDADLPGFSVTTYNEYPTKWRSMQSNWNDIFQNAEYDVNFKINVTKIGLVKNVQPSKNQGGKKDDPNDNYSISTNMPY